MTLIKTYFLPHKDVLVKISDIVLFANNEIGVYIGGGFISPYEDYVDRGRFFRFLEKLKLLRPKYKRRDLNITDEAYLIGRTHNDTD